jgi:microcompartment protein CcmL/EutN
MITYGTGTYAGVLTVITGDISEVRGIVQAGMTAQGKALWESIAAIRAKSDEIEAINPILSDYKNDSYWS